MQSDSSHESSATDVEVSGEHATVSAAIDSDALDLDVTDADSHVALVIDHPYQRIGRAIRPWAGRAHRWFDESEPVALLGFVAGLAGAIQLFRIELWGGPTPLNLTLIVVGDLPLALVVAAALVRPTSSRARNVFRLVATIPLVLCLVGIVWWLALAITREDSGFDKPLVVPFGVAGYLACPLSVWLLVNRQAGSHPLPQTAE
jgi:hypothetical protein